jgi:hypothetical protein
MIGLEQFERELERLSNRVLPLARIVHAFSESLGSPPIRDQRQMGYRYPSPDHRHFCLMRAARVVSGLNALVLLARGSFPQEIGVLVRTVNEFMRQMEAVCLLVQRHGNVGGELREFIIAYFYR